MIKKTQFKDLLIFKNFCYRDTRGYFKELLKEKNFKKKFPFTVMSYSKKKCDKGSTFTNKKYTREIYIST